MSRILSAAHRSVVVAVLTVGCRDARDAPARTEPASPAVAADAPVEVPAEPTAEPPAPAAIRIDGRWTIRTYDVELDPPLPGAWLSNYSASFGLELGIGAPGRFGLPESTLELRTNCEGACKPDQFGSTIRDQMSARVLERMGDRGDTPEWVQAPTEIAHATWMMHARGTNRAGRVVREQIVFAYASARSDRGWLECVVDAVAPLVDDRERIAALSSWCRDLKWRHEGERRAPIEARFGGRYRIRGVDLEVPTPTGFRFESYSAARSTLELRGVDNIFDAVQLSPDCAGTCVPERLEANLRKYDAERLATLRADGDEIIVDVALTKVSPGRFRRRIRRIVLDKPTIEIQVVAIPERSDHLVRCDVTLQADAMTRADELEALCTEALSAFST